VLIALVLGAIGVPDEIIAADYAATELFLTEEFRLTVKVRNDASGGTPSRLAAILRCEPELMLSLLEEIRSIHGDIGGYLQSEGMTAAELELLRQLLTTAP
jgi:protein-tyrosine phosphatase